MERLFERFVCNNTRCYSCGTLVYAVEKKKTTNHVYHNRCFCCRICKRNLTGATLNEEGDDIYCTNCYRKKQRGDCNGLDFQRAAKERAQYVHNRRHPDQPSPKPNPAAPVQRDFSRQTSWTLRRLERRYLSHQEPNTKEFQEVDKKYRQTISTPAPLTIRTDFSLPNSLKNTRRASSLTRNDSSSSSLAQFFPVFSPFPNAKSEPPALTPRTPRTPQPFNRVKLRSINSIGDMLRQGSRGSMNSIGERPRQESRSSMNSIGERPGQGSRGSLNSIGERLRQGSSSSIDSTYSRSSPRERKSSLIFELNNQNEKRAREQDVFRFPETNTTSNRQRSRSVSYSNNPLKIN